MLLLILISVTLPTLLILLNSLLFKKDINNREKISPFECGFDPKTTSRIPFSIRFYLIAIIFLIFDIEITLLMPIPAIFNLNTLEPWTLLSSTFIMILLFGVLHEWHQGALDWAK